MHYVFDYYSMILSFCGQHPFFAFFTFPIWAVLLLGPIIIVGELIDLVIESIKKVFKIK